MQMTKPNAHTMSHTQQNGAATGPRAQKGSIPGLALLQSKSTVPKESIPKRSKGSKPSHDAQTPQQGPQRPPEKKGRKSKHASRKQSQALASNPEPKQCASSTKPSGARQNSEITAAAHSRLGPDQRSAPDVGEARQPPSLASGGVPDPTPLYLAQCFGPPTSLPEPRRILIIMDLNGTLLFRPSKRRPFDFVERPHARRFLSYCLDTFQVAIWSSARPDNVNKMVGQLLTTEQRATCVVTWARDRFGFCPADYDARVQCYKRLTRIWQDPDILASHPASAHGGRWDQTNTVLVDDSLEKGRSEPHNILQIPDFSGQAREPADVLPQVHDYLNTLSYQSDISKYMRQSPFQLDPNYQLPPQPPS